MAYYKDLENKIHFLDSQEFFSLLPTGSVPISDQEAYAYQNPVPSVAQLKQEYINAVQEFIDKVAAAKGYDSGVSCASYFNDPHPPFNADAQAFVPWRSSVWLKCYSDFAAIEAGTMPFPTSTTAYIATLPATPWPV